MQLDTPIPAKYTEVLGNIVDYYGINLFDFDYDLPADTGYTKDQIQQAFINRFYFREIGQETVDMFKVYLRQTWGELIPYYSKIFAANALADPTDLSNDEYDSGGMVVYNDAPKGVIEFDKVHATNYTKHDNKTKGRRGRTKAELSRSYRDVAYNPLSDFLDDLNDLFMQIY